MAAAAPIYNINVTATYGVHTQTRTAFSLEPNAQLTGNRARKKRIQKERNANSLPIYKTKLNYSTNTPK